MERKSTASLGREFDLVPLLAWQLDGQSRFVMVRGHGSPALEVAPHPLVGRSVWELYGDTPDLVDALQQVFAGHEREVRVEIQGICFDFWMRPLFDEQGYLRGVFGVACAVTARGRAEIPKRKSHRPCNGSLRPSTAGIIVTNLQSGKILDVNPALIRLIGQPRSAIVGATPASLGLTIAPNGFAPVATPERPAGEWAPVPGSDLTRARLKLPSGKRRSMTVIGQEVEWNGLPSLLWIVRDDLNYRLKLLKLRQSYQILSRFAPVGIFQTRNDGTLTSVNRHCRELLQSTRQNLLSDGWWPLVSDEDRTLFLSAWNEAIAARSSLEYEFRVRLSDAETWLLLTLEPTVKFEGFVGSLVNIDRRKQAELDLQIANQRLEVNVHKRTDMLERANKSLVEQIFARRRTYEELLKSEERWRALVENAPDVILLVDLDGRIEYLNHTGLRPELPKEAVMGREVYEFAYPEFHEEIRQVLREVFDKGRQVTQEVLGPGDDGEPHWYQSHLAPIRYQHRVIGATVIVRDVTDQRQAHEELRQTQDRLAHVGRVSMVGQMMAGFAHELGQPLFAISSAIEGCLRRLQRQNQTPEEVLEVLSDSVTQSHRAIEVVRGLREFLHRQEIHRTLTGLNDIVRDSLKLTEVALRKYAVRQELDLADDLPDLFVDRVQIMQVFVNLILNASEAMHESQMAQPLLTIRTQYLENHRVRCEIIDNGPGLPPSSTHEIFEAFVTTKSQGLGLGLSISRSIVEVHEGTISAKNGDEGCGAVFCVEFPVAQSTSTSLSDSRKSSL